MQLGTRMKLGARRAAIALLAIASTMAACGSRTGDPARPTGGAADGDAAGPRAITGDAGVLADAALTRAECEQLVDHMLGLGMAEQRRIKPVDQVPTDDQVAAIRIKMLGEIVPPCLELTRAAWQCAMAAETQPVLYDCAK